ncbi:MAG: hypothetical protein NVSMB55_10900 [Mycobacteriales bacterium]
MTDVGVPELLRGRYEVGPVIGAGGMARVHRATDTILGRAVAVKIFRTDVETHDAQRVQDESRTLAALNHPGLVGVFDAGVTSGPGAGSPYLVMELVDGPTLAQCCLDGSLPPAKVARIGAELAGALAHVHDRGIVHRDVKPANILLDRNRHAKLTDFGIARLVDSARHTATGLTVGTAPYLSPEQVTGGPVGPATDVYALGLVLLECLTGQREYPGNGVETALARLHRPPNVPTTLPDPWPGLLTAMTDPDPGRRPSAADAAAALRTGSPLPGPAAPGTPPTAVLTVQAPLVVPSPSRSGRQSQAPAPSAAWEAAGRGIRKRPLVAGIALLGLLMVLLALAATSESSRRPPPPATTPAGQLDRDLNDLQKAVTS